MLVSGCTESEMTTSTTKNPDAEEILSFDPNGDIFQWDGTIYKTDIDWVNELKLTKKEELGEITEVYSGNDPALFKNTMATNLPIGAKIFSAKERGDIFIVEYDDQVKYYLAVVEG